MRSGVLRVRESLSRVETYSGKSELVFSEPKTVSGKREIPLLPNILQELKSHKARQAEDKLFLGWAYYDDELIFTTSEGTPIEPRTFLRKHKSLLKKAGLREEIRVHDLRHTFGTMLGQSQENPANIQKLMGHTNVRTTLQTYCHSTLEDKKRVIEKLAAIIKI